ncbi:hypothetical protein ACERK3_14835 [Phycisphaerales bacterium AB-hyl4]|uniref:Uncharacterized protein n=1 Tax=Natronomicrosphaera hydrolytica TaxID=3242702 RepID=A0ABV4U7J5_9BACT
MLILERIKDAWAIRWVRYTLGSAVAVVCLTVGGWLIADYIASIPPDPANDDAAVVIDFFFSDHFERMSSVDRRAYTDALLARYQSMDRDQRGRLAETFSEQRDADRDRSRERMIELARNFMLREAETYADLPPEARAEWLEGRMGMWRMMGMDGDRRGGGGGGNRDRDREESRPEMTAERQVRTIAFFQDEVLPRSTARERALITTLMRDVIHQHRRN